jgi:rhodanese-related sulfurtransferase
MKRKLTVSLIALGISLLAAGANAGPSNEIRIPEVKQILSGNYLTSRQAQALLVMDETIVFIDVRDTVEIGQSGYPAYMDAIVPLRIRTPEFDESLKEYRLADNPTFLKEVNDIIQMEGVDKGHMIIVSCGSGMRSAIAANKLTRAGYTNVWHIPDGYEGDDKPGLNTQHAWKNAGLPWSKDLIHGSEWRLLIQ